MPVSGMALAYTAIGGVVFYSGFKGSTLTNTVQHVLQGNLNVTPGQTIGTPSVTETGNSSSAAAGGSATNVTSSSDNYLAIARYLVSNGYSIAAAAGIVGCIAGESGGDPEALEDKGTPVASNSGGGGLIQWTPISAHANYVTGNPSADLDTQLPAIIAYNNAQGGSLVQMLKVMTDPVQAADFYSQHFERPAVANSDVRAGVATSVYNQLLTSATGT